jgi:hypothetical protein
LIQNWNFQEGVPLTFSSPCNGISCRPNLIGDPAAGRSSKRRQQVEEQWYNPGAFTAPFGSDPAVIQAISNGTADFNALDQWWQFGNVGEGPPSGRAPGYWNADMTLGKDMHISERRYFQFRWEVFNAFNHQTLGFQTGVGVCRLTLTEAPTLFTSSVASSARSRMCRLTPEAWNSG